TEQTPPDDQANVDAEPPLVAEETPPANDVADSGVESTFPVVPVEESPPTAEQTPPDDQANVDAEPPLVAEETPPANDVADSGVESTFPVALIEEPQSDTEQTQHDDQANLDVTHASAPRPVIIILPQGNEVEQDSTNPLGWIVAASPAQYRVTALWQTVPGSGSTSRSPVDVTSIVDRLRQEASSNQQEEFSIQELGELTLNSNRLRVQQLSGSEDNQLFLGDDRSSFNES
ncbi:MAG: hypothetical protein MI725_14930, partial [Pirellulales bacterium]|nr:hypothetical protein [Pirellulales bacterium]